jgi:hypothetical protein
VQVLADNGGHVLAEDGSRLLFLSRQILPSWLTFVPGVLALVTIGNGAVQLAIGNLLAGVVLLAVGAVSVLGVRAVLRRRARAIATPLDPATALLVIDLGTNTLRDRADLELAPLEAVRVERSMQLTSSARALRIVWPGGAMIVYRGDALRLRGSIGPPVAALRARGVPVTD